MAAKRKAEQQPDETPESQTTAAAPLPAPGIGPLAKYPVPPGATHWRVHGIAPDGRIRDAMSLINDADGAPITRYPISTLGDPAWWDALPSGTVVRVVFTRYHGDQLKARLGQGPIWTVPTGGERVDKREAPPPAPTPPPMPTNTDGSLFMVLRDLQREARQDARIESERHLSALQSMLLSQAENQRAFYDAMTRMFVGERGAERASVAAERAAERKAERERIEALRGVVRDELAAARAEDDDDDDDDDDGKQKGDAIANAIESLGQSVKPLAEELGKRAAKGIVG